MIINLFIIYIKCAILYVDQKNIYKYNNEKETDINKYDNFYFEENENELLKLCKTIK